MTKLHACIAFTGILAAAWCGAGFAQQSATQPDTGANLAKENQGGKGGAAQLSRKDQSFMKKAAEGGLAEVEIGKLAASKASSDEVKKFADQMVQDHGQANDELKQIAESKGMQLPTQTDRSHQRAEKSLDKKSGADFDKAYMTDMVKDHRKDLKEFQKAAKDARDPDLKAFAEKTAQVIQGHLDMAQQVAASVGAKGGKTARTSSREKTASSSAASGQRSGEGG